MNHNLSTFIALLLLPASALLAADNAAATVTASDRGGYNTTITRTESTVIVDMTLRLADIKVKSEQQLIVTPALVNGDNRLDLPGITVTGRNRALRDAREHIATPAGYTAYRAGKVPAELPYHVEVPVADWMLDADLIITDSLSGCNCAPLTGGSELLATLDLRPRIFAPQYEYIAPVAEAAKIREAAGHAYIDFPVNKTAIYPDYRRNPQELAAIRDTIELIKNDPDYTITELTLKGYASPEGSYANNERLAKGRTEALREYIRGLYDFPASILRSEWEAEDWQGLIAWLRASDLPDREAMIAVCTDPVFDGNDDGREWRLKSRFPKQYRMLLADVYPGLRHTDYTVRYTVRTYTSTDEIARVMKTAPSKLSLREMYLLAQTLQPGSPEYNEVFETAVRLYPAEPEANLNAALAALQSGDLDRASRYLDRAGDSPEAAYARGILAAKRADYDTALPLLEAAEKGGIAKAADARAQLQEIIKRQPSRP